MCEYFLSDIHKIILLIQIHDLILQFNLWLKTNINARSYYFIDNSVNTARGGGISDCAPGIQVILHRWLAPRASDPGDSLIRNTERALRKVP